MFRICKNKKKGLCQAHGCKNKHTPKDRFCSKHRHRLRKAKDPVSYAYHNLKSHARERNKEFSLTLEEFKRFCERTNYIEESGRSATSASIDRRCVVHGYHAWNIQKLSLSDNSKKRHEEYSCPF